MKKIILFLISVILFSSLATALTFPYHIDFEEGDFSDVTGSQFNISTSDCMGSYCAYIDRNSQIMYVELGAFDVYTIECYFYIRDMTTQEFSFLTATTGTTTYANLNYIVPLSKSNYGALHNISFYQGAWFYGITPDYPENEWFPVRVFYNDTSNNRTLWYNNTKYFSSTGGSTNGDIGSLIFNTRDSASLNLSVDNCTIWRDLVPPPTELAPVLNVYFSNSTYDNNKTNFQESENFFIYFNWSLNDGTLLNNESGNCNISLEKGIDEIESIAYNFTLCGTGCTYNYFSEIINFTGEHNHSEEKSEDFIRFKVCHDKLFTEDLFINVSCGNNYYDFNINAVDFTTCLNGFTPLMYNFSNCENETEFNISFDNGATFNKRHRILDFEINREYIIHWINDSEYIFNSTIGMFQIIPSHEYYEHGLKNISVNCIHKSESLYDKSKLTRITIFNTLPEIFIEGFIMPDLSIENLSYDIEFQNGTWILGVTIIDDDLRNYNISLYNSTQLIFSTTSLENLINISSSYFVDLENPYNISVFANDTNNNASFLSVVFNVNDTTNPTFSGFEDSEVIAGVNYTWNAQLNDEYLWSFEISCNNNFTFNVTNLARKNYVFNKSMNVPFTTLCKFNISDGHTANIMRDVSISTVLKDNILNVDGIVLQTLEPLSKITTLRQLDKVSFCFETLEEQTELNINIPDGCDIAPNSKYKGHYVCYDKKLAIDFEGDYPIISQRYDSIVIDIRKAKTKEICFNSIVELNTVSGNQTITLINNPDENITKFKVDSIENAVFLFALIILYLGVMFLGFAFKNKGFTAMGFFIGIIIGFMLGSFHIIFPFIFIFLNVVISLSVSKTFK